MNRSCSIEGCAKKQVARGWCAMHYERWRSTGTTYREPAKSGCAVDGCDKPHSAKGYCRGHYQTMRRGLKPVLHRNCVHCGQPITDRLRSAELHQECIADHQKNVRYKREYGITLQEYNDLALFQEHRCAICSERPADRLHVDHDHVFGHVRGLLCGDCNRAVGLLRDDTYRVKSAHEYLIKPPVVLKTLAELGLGGVA